MTENSKIFYFAKARTALKYGFQALGFKKDDEILVPDYACESIFQPISQESLNFVAYGTKQDLSPSWNQLDSLISPKVKAILMVHYFGQPQDIDKFISFSHKHNISLIEDNAHGHGGRYKGKLLGTFGHIGISSPRKLLETENGGVLYLNKELQNFKLPNLKECGEPKKLPLHMKILNKFPNFKHKIKYYSKKRASYENPRIFREPYADDLLLDKKTRRLIEAVNWDSFSFNRRRKYLVLEKMLSAKGLTPVFDKVDGASNPWCFSAYINDEKEAKFWFDWGWKNNLETYSWPTLREDQISNQNRSFKRWKKLICFSIKN